MSNQIQLDKHDKKLARMVKIAEKIEAFDGGKLGAILIGAGTGMLLLSTKKVGFVSVNFINSVYEKFRDKYKIPAETFIAVGLKDIDLIDLH